MKKPRGPWAMELPELSGELACEPARGLTCTEADERLKDAGTNKITYAKPITFFDILWEEVREPLILLLLIIGLLYSIWGDIGDTIMILCIILAVTLAEVYTEYKAKKSIESMKTLAQPTTWVLRGGMPTEIETSRIVPGDVLILKAGVKISADARILECYGLEADESQLTGESMGITKSSGAIARDTGLPDRINMVHMGSVIRKGKGTALVTATGMDTELGKIAGLTEEAREPKTPLQKSMKQLSKCLIWVAVFFSVLVPVIGLLRGQPLQEMILTGLSFAFATIPEEMPIIITMVLGLGAMKLSKKNVLIKRTKAAETLGSVTIIATDKTGTLTENKMRVNSYFTRDEKRLFMLGALMADISCGNQHGFLGDPMDNSVIETAAQLGIDRNMLLKEYALIADNGFDEDAKVFQSVFRCGENTFTVIKGAPESVLTLSVQDTEMETKLHEAMSGGVRTIAVASKDNAQASYTMEGLISFDDPIRQGVPEAIASCYGAGVQVLMITGDHAATARRVAENAGIRVRGVCTGDEIRGMSPEDIAVACKECNVFARITPQQKLIIVTALRENGEVIAVTGDGINDAPALKAADIGISMGLTGTDVAKEAADMILTDDSFTGIVTAIAEGRRLFDNLSKCVKYYLACKAALILVILIPTLLNIPLPFSPIQIIILELFMDLAASTSFVTEPQEAGMLRRKPRDPNARFMDRSMVTGIFSGGITLALTVLILYLSTFYSGIDADIARTYAFILWMLGHVCLAFNMRTGSVPLTKAGVFSSSAFNVWMLGVIVFLAAALNIPVLRTYLSLMPVGIVPVLCLAAIALIATSWMELVKINAHRKPREH